MILTQKGNNLLMLDGYTYSCRSKNLYYCSKREYSGCKARVKLRPNGTIEFADTTHAHERPKYYVSTTGKYVKI